MSPVKQYEAIVREINSVMEAFRDALVAIGECVIRFGFRPASRRGHGDRDRMNNIDPPVRISEFMIEAVRSILQRHALGVSLRFEVTIALLPHPQTGQVNAGMVIYLDRPSGIIGQRVGHIILVDPAISAIELEDFVIKGLAALNEQYDQTLKAPR